MAYDDDPPEPTEEEIQEQEARRAARETPIRIEGLTFAAVESCIRGILESNYRLTEKLESKLDEAIEEHVGKLVADTTRDRIAVAVDAAIAEGFPLYDRYSGRETERTTVAALVHKHLTERVDRGYDEKGHVAEIAVRKAVKELFEKHLGDTTKALVADFKKQADEVFKAKLVAGMKEAIGLKA